MTNVTVSDQLQQMWRTRPNRMPQRGHVAGVAAGIGYRYNVDPVLIRVAFVVSTLFGGTGIVLYLAAWLVLNRAGDDASAAQSLIGRGSSSESTTKVVVLVVALAIAISTIGPVGVGLGGSGLISLAAMLGGLWLLHQRCPQPPPYLSAADLSRSGYPATAFGAYTPPNPPAGTHTSAEHYAAAQYRPPQFQQYSPYTTLPASYVPAPKADTEPVTNHTVNLDKAKPAVTAPTEDALSPTPPAWDPLGVAPFAWDLPEPAGIRSPSTTPRRRRSRWTPSFIGLALVAAAVTAAVGEATGGDWASPARIGAAALAVLALGAMLGAFLRKGYGLLVLAAPLAGFVVLASIIGPLQFEDRTSGAQQVAPLTMADLQTSYDVGAGELELDLTGLELTENRSVKIDVALGSATVVVPNTMNIHAMCSTALGSADCGPSGVQRGSAAAPDNNNVLTIEGNVALGELKVETRR